MLSLNLLASALPPVPAAGAHAGAPSAPAAANGGNDAPHPFTRALDEASRQRTAPREDRPAQAATACKGAAPADPAGARGPAQAGTAKADAALADSAVAGTAKADAALADAASAGAAKADAAKAGSAKADSAKAGSAKAAAAKAAAAKADALKAEAASTLVPTSARTANAAPDDASAPDATGDASRDKPKAAAVADDPAALLVTAAAPARVPSVASAAGRAGGTGQGAGTDALAATAARGAPRSGPVIDGQADSTASRSAFASALQAATAKADEAGSGEAGSSEAASGPAATLPTAAGPDATPAGPAPAPASLLANGVAAGATPVDGRLAAHPASPAFASQLGAQLSTFVRDGVQHARLELNPAEMGPVTVQIQIDGQTAQVHLAAGHAQTRQALEQAMPTLAGSLREAGLTLSGGGVSEQPRQPPQPAAATAATAAAGGTDEGPGRADAALRTGATAARRRGVVDLVA